MRNNITYTTCSNKQQLQAILNLQKENLERNVSDVELENEGYVTAEHDLELLSKMNVPYPHVIALLNDQLAGYALMMTRSFSKEVPVLIEMFRKIDEQSFKGSKLGDIDYVVMGQICVAKEYRGKGVFYGLYEHMTRLYQHTFKYLITMVAQRNSRSLKAHLNAGFVPLHNYQSNGEDWHIIILDWSSS